MFYNRSNTSQVNRINRHLLNHFLCLSFNEHVLIWWMYLLELVTIEKIWKNWFEFFQKWTSTSFCSSPLQKFTDFCHKVDFSFTWAYFESSESAFIWAI